MEQNIMDALPDEVLMKIINYLPKPDRIRFERVCKRWQKICLNSWMQEKELYLKNDFYMENNEDDVDDRKDNSDEDNARPNNSKKLQISNVDDILRRCGEYLTHLSLAGLHHLEPKSIFVLINKYCKNLVYLDISIWALKDKDFIALSNDIVKNLTEIHINGTCIRDSRELTNFLKKAVKLQNFSFVNNIVADGSSLLALSKTLKSLDVESSGVADSVLSRLPKLEHLGVSYTDIWPTTLSKVCKKLKSLNMAGLSAFFEDDLFNKILTFPKIKKLDASNQGFEDLFLTFISEKCPLLEYLNLNKCWTCEADPDAYKRLGKLKKLVYLDISETEVTDDVLEYLVSELENLKVLKCADCKGVTESSINIILTYLSKLDYLYIDLVPNLQIDSFLDTAVQSVLMRTDNKPLKVGFVSEAKVDDVVNMLTQQSEGVRISTSFYLEICIKEKKCHAYDIEIVPLKKY